MRPSAGLKKIPIIRAEHLTPSQAKEFIVKDNVGFGEWEWEALLDQYDASDLAGGVSMCRSLQEQTKRRPMMAMKSPTT